MKENKANWITFFQWLKCRGLIGVKLTAGDKYLGMLEAVGEVFPEVKGQRCVVHFYHNVFSVVPKSKVKLVAKMLKAIHAQERKKASREKAKAVVEELKAMKLREAAKKVEDGIEETLTYIMRLPYPLLKYIFIFFCTHCGWIFSLLYPRTKRSQGFRSWEPFHEKAAPGAQSSPL